MQNLQKLRRIFFFLTGAVFALMGLAGITVLSSSPFANINLVMVGGGTLYLFGGFVMLWSVSPKTLATTGIIVLGSCLVVLGYVSIGWQHTVTAVLMLFLVSLVGYALYRSPPVKNRPTILG